MEQQQSSSTPPSDEKDTPQPLEQIQTLPTPPVMPVAEAANKKHHSTALEVVLQWMTYMFWFWTLVTISTMLGATISYFVIDNNNSTDWVTYAIGPLIVLYVAGFFSDKYYRKIEPVKKHGFAAVVMVVNAIFAILFAVASLITAVVTLTTLITDSGNTDVKIVTLSTSLVVAFLALLFFIRIIFMEKLAWFREKFWLVTLAIVGISLVLTIAGPMVNKIKRRTDNLIADNYYSIRSQISEYAQENNKLPDSLNDVDFEDGAKEAIETGKITYSKLDNNFDRLNSTKNEGLSINRYSNRSSGEYELCVDWDYEKKGYYYDSYSSSKRFYGGAHKAGKECYEESAYFSTIDYLE